MGETPFPLTYGAEVVIPTEVSLCNAQVVGFDPIQNADLMMERLDWLEECRDAVTIQLAEYQQRLTQRYNRDIKGREFSTGDLVLRKVMGNMRDIGVGKLAQTWKGLYRVTAIASARAYYLEDLDERPIPRPWNVHNLKKFHL